MSAIRLTSAAVISCLLLAISVACYGPLITDLGFYKDDWRNIWTYHALGTSGIRELLSMERPYNGNVWVAACSLLGETPLRWHAFALVVRSLGSVAIWALLCMMWPGDRLRTTGIALLFATYPGFSQQHYVTISIYLFQMLVHVVSLIAMAFAIRGIYRPVMLLSSLLLACHAALQSEYFLGLELVLRPIVAFSVVAQRCGGRAEAVRRALAWSAPYLGVLAVVGMWRVFYFVPAIGGDYDQRNIVARIRQAPLDSCIAYLRIFVSDVCELTVMAWAETCTARLFSSGAIFALMWVIMAVAGVFAGVALVRSADVSESGAFPPATCGVGFVLLCGGMAPFWLGFRNFALSSDASRFALGGMLGAAMLTGGLIEFLIPRRGARIVVLASLVALSAGYHFRNANEFRRDWRQQRDMYWQLAWRIPSLEPGTSLLFDDVPFIDRRSYTIAVPVNYLFDGESPTRDLKYWACNVSVDVGVFWPELVPETEMRTDYLRGFRFGGTAERAVAVMFHPPSSLRVLTPEEDPHDDARPLARNLRCFSSMAAIRLDDGPPRRSFERLFGPEPNHGWAYYFQKASLAAQFLDWSTVTELGRQIINLDLKPADTSEYCVFVEGFCQCRDFKTAVEFASMAIRKDSSVRPFVRRILLPWSDEAIVQEFLARIETGQVNLFWQNENHTRR